MHVMCRREEGYIYSHMTFNDSHMIDSSVGTICTQLGIVCAAL